MSRRSSLATSHSSQTNKAASAMAHHGQHPIVLHLLLQIQLVVAIWSLLPSSSTGGYMRNHTTATLALPVPCLPDQTSALLRLRRSFITTNYSVAIFRSWRAGTDCCRWLGVSCSDSDGRVTSLNLGDCNLKSGHFDPAVFELTSLRYLNLGGNDFNQSQLPSIGFERLTKLTNLNLSTCNFGVGEVPHGIGRLTNLVSLDLSIGTGIDYVPGMYVQYFAESAMWQPIKLSNVTTLVANLDSLRELHLGFVDLSKSIKWCDAIAKHTPNLQVLSLPFCYVPSPICASLSTLHSLSVIDLQHNALSGPIPDFFPSFPNLSVLRLSYNDLKGMVSPAIFKHKKLVTIDIHHNSKISGSLPHFSADSCLKDLLVGYTSFSGTIPSSIGNLKSLVKLGLDASGFSGNLPSSIGTLKSINDLRVSGFELIGPIPSWIANLTSLEVLQFSHCGLYGSIPSYIGGLSKLRILALYDCKFSGDISPHFSNLTQVGTLALGLNNFTGTFELNSLWKLPNLSGLSLSNNKLVVVDGEHNSSSMVSYPRIINLRLGSCGIKNFPNILRHLNEIEMLDLSNNQIHGAIPQWIWGKLINNGISLLDFSHNKLTNIGYDTFLPISPEMLDLSFNLLEGTIALPQHSTFELDYSNNMFSSMPLNISSQLEGLAVFRASRNNLSGNLSPSFCSNDLQILDLSYNTFNGSIPSCLMEDANSLEILNLRENQLHGELSVYIKENCTLLALDLNGNKIRGQLPKSLAFCKMLEVLDIGNNEISDSFPCWMSELPSLQVLVLKYNEFFGQIGSTIDSDKISCEFPSLRILDLASNNFSGTLSKEWFSKLTSMMINTNNETLVMEYLGYQGELYDVATELTYKSSDRTIEKILRTLVFLDLSNNALRGSIPTAIGELVLLDMLNMSHNSLTGPIPSQLGHLTQLEVLDLSSNELSCKIPQELASLDFLTTLNLSDNKLVGSIPESTQFLTFSNSSFLGNDGLCGPPLSKACINTTQQSAVSHHFKKKPDDIILFLCVGLGFGVGFAIAIVVAWAIPSRKWS